MGDQIVDCVVLNISVGSTMIRVTGPVDTASPVRLRIERIGEFSGRVVWRNGTTMGIQFHDQLGEIEPIVKDMLPSTKQRRLE